MIKILYCGTRYLDIVSIIPKNKKFVILDYENFLSFKDQDFIKYVDNVDDLYKNNEHVNRIMIKSNIEYDHSTLRDFLIIDKFDQHLPEFKTIGIHGDKKLVIQFIDFLAKTYNCGINLKIGGWQKEYFKEESLFKNISKFNGQILFGSKSLIDIVLDGSESDINIFLWNGQIERIYKWKSYYSSKNSFLFSYNLFKTKNVKDKWDIKIKYVNKYNLKRVWNRCMFELSMI